MKKKISIFLTVVFLLSLFTNVFAAETNNTRLSFNLTYNGENNVTVSSGAVITVEYNLENISSDEAYTIQSVTNEIYFDNEFFEYLGDDKIVKDELTSAAKENVYSGDEHRIYFNGSHINKTEYAQKQFLGSFQLKVTAKKGSSTISSKAVTAYDNDGKKYSLTTGDLTVNVGNAPSVVYTVTYKSNGETVSTVRTAGSMKLATPPSVPSGFRFLGWECDADGKLYQPNKTYNVTKDVTFTAKWEKIEEVKKYTLTFNTNGGSNVKSITKNEVTTIDLSAYTTEKSGYTFKGWYSDSSLTNKVTSITLDSDKTVYAKWEKDSSGTTGGNSGVTKYTLTFETNGGTNVSSVSKVRNTTVDLSKYITKKDGYSFEGWYTDKELTKKVTKIKMTENITLYAKWTQGNDIGNSGTNTDKPNYKPDIFSNDHYAYIVGRDGGYIYPTASLTRAEAAEMFYRLLNSEVRAEALSRESGFSDVDEGDWFNTSISTLVNLGVLNGRTADSFDPLANITRAELTTIIVRLSEATYDGETMFRDIKGHWAESNINVAASINWVTGNDGLFRPNDSITRAEVITLINRALNRLPENKSDLLDSMITPPDNTDENAWYYLAVQEAVNSHDFKQKEDNIHEKWTELTQNPDWSNLND